LKHIRGVYTGVREISLQ